MHKNIKNMGSDPAQTDGDSNSIYVLIVPRHWSSDFLGVADENNSILLSELALDEEFTVHHELGHNGQYNAGEDAYYDPNYPGNGKESFHSKKSNMIMHPYNSGDKHDIDEPYCEALLKNCK